MISGETDPPLNIPAVKWLGGLQTVLTILHAVT